MNPPRRWKTCPKGGVHNLEGQKPYFTISLKVNDYIGAKPCKKFRLERIAQHAPWKYVPELNSMVKTIEILELECGLGHVMRSHNVYSKW